MTLLSHCQIQYASYKTFSSLWITPETLTSIWGGSYTRSDDQVSAYTHTCFCSSFSKFSSWALHKTLGSTKGSSALCFFHNLGFRYHAPYLIFTHFGLWGFCTNNIIPNFISLVCHFNKSKIKLVKVVAFIFNLCLLLSKAFYEVSVGFDFTNVKSLRLRK